MKLKRNVETPELIAVNEQKIVQEIQEIFFNSTTWNQFKEISKLFSQIKEAGEIIDPDIFNVFLGRLLKDDETISARSLIPKEGETEELPAYSKKLEKILKNPELHPDAKIFQPYLNISYEPRDRSGGGDGYLINLVRDKKTGQTTAIEISIFDLAGHGAETINIRPNRGFYGYGAIN